MPTDDDEPTDIPAHHSAVRHMVAKGTQQPYDAFENLQGAAGHEDSTVVMEGDSGGQIYMTCPLRHVRCDQETLEQLLADLNDLAWGDGEGLYFETLPVGSGVAGGMGGGLVVDGLWLHQEFIEMGLFDTVSAVVRGDAKRIVVPDGAREKRW